MPARCVWVWPSFPLPPWEVTGLWAAELPPTPPPAHPQAEPGQSLQRACAPGSDPLLGLWAGLAPGRGVGSWANSSPSSSLSFPVGKEAAMSSDARPCLSIEGFPGVSSTSQPRAHPRRPTVVVVGSPVGGLSPSSADTGVEQVEGPRLASWGQQLPGLCPPRTGCARSWHRGPVSRQVPAGQ